MRKFRITERVVSIKKHTVGYVLKGQEFTRSEVTRLAKQGHVQQVRIARGPYGAYVTGVGSRLYDLPTRYPRTKRLANKIHC